MAAATTDFARIGATIDPAKGIDLENVKRFADIGIKVHQSMTANLSEYYKSPSTVNPEMITAAKSSREGDHEDSLLQNYRRYFDIFLNEGGLSIVDDTKEMFEWFRNLSRFDLISLFKRFRDAALHLEDIPSMLKLLHKVHCDGFEMYFGGNARGKGSEFELGICCLEVFHLIAKTSNATMRGHPPPPRPIQLIVMLMGNLVAVTPLWNMLIQLQTAKDNRQRVSPPENVTVYPDQTVLCDFFVWSHAFFSFLNGVWLGAKKDRLKPLGDRVESPADPVFGPELEALLSKSVVPLGAPRRNVRGAFVLNQQPLWLTVPSSKSGLKFQPWAVDLVVAGEPDTAPIRLGKLPFFTSRPGWTGQLVALFEHCDKHKYEGVGALLSSISFSSPTDTLAAHVMVAAPPLDMGCNTNEELDALVCRQKISDNAFSLSKESTQVAKLDKNEHTEIYWQLHAEPLSMKGGKMTYEYLKFWYQRAAAFFRAKPWTKCPSQVVVEVWANGIGRRNVLICGSNGTPTALRMFKVSKMPDLEADHDACIFTSKSNCAVADLKMVDDFELEIADEFGYPTLFSGYNKFKRPPFAELEMYRVCFDLFTEYFSDKMIDPSWMVDQSKWCKSSHDISVLGEAHPARVELLIPPEIYRDDPETINVGLVDRDIVADVATLELCKAYDEALESYHTNDADAPAAIEMVTTAISMNVRVAAYLLGQKKLPVYESITSGKPETPGKVLEQQAAAYCMRSLDTWREVPGALRWLELHVHKQFPLPPRVIKCGYGVCNNAGTPGEFKRCSACKMIHYCCVACQKKDWPSHKLACKRLKAASVASS